MQVIYEFQSIFKGQYPQVPFAPGITEDAWADEPENERFFVTLPIGEVGATSRNGRHYDRETVESIVRQINDKRPGGNKGHISQEEMATRFDLPVVMWVGATLDERGKAWGKAYVPRYASDVREYLKLAMRRGAPVATSIMGDAEVSDDGVVKNLNLWGIDLADPERAGVRAAVAVPNISREQVEPPAPQTGASPMSEITELLTERDSLKAQISELTTKLTAAQDAQATVARIAEIVKSQDPVVEIARLTTERGQLITLLGGDDVVARIEDYQRQLRDAGTALGGPNIVERAQALTEQTQNATNDKQALLSRVMELHVETAVRVPKARAVVLELLRAVRPNTLDDIVKETDAILGRDSIKEMLQALVIEEMGPNQTRPPVEPGDGKGEKKQFKYIVEESPSR